MVNSRFASLTALALAFVSGGMGLTISNQCKEVADLIPEQLTVGSTVPYNTKESEEGFVEFTGPALAYPGMYFDVTSLDKFLDKPSSYQPHRYYTVAAEPFAAVKKITKSADYYVVFQHGTGKTAKAVKTLQITAFQPCSFVQDIMVGQTLPSIDQVTVVKA
jgi:hypothetical protein